MKPAQYIGGEVNSITKDWASVDVSWCLMYPDTYGVGQPNQGLAILYEVLNERDWVVAERTFSVWGDLASLMRQNQVPQFSWETTRPVRDFDVLGVSLATELGFTNLLEALDLAGIPLHAADRGEDDPLVIVGGHVATNPEPVADFIDAAVLGDGEEAVLEISRILRAAKRAGWRGFTDRTAVAGASGDTAGGAFSDERVVTSRPGDSVVRDAVGGASSDGSVDGGEPLRREDVLARLAATGRVYVPRFYDVAYGQDGAIASVRPNRAGVPERVRKYTLTRLNDWPYPKHPIVPLAETVHERYSAEIFRGCLRGCRFCQAGMITRPVRERSVDVIGQMVECGLAATGYEEVSLLSLSSADHSEIDLIAGGLSERYAGTNISLSLPSTRVDAFNLTLADELSRNGRRSGLTFAPEGGTERMRRVINKNVDEADLLATVEAAFAAGWRSVKLYFMAGLPTETDEDVMAIGDLARRVIDVGRAVTGRRDVSCTLSVGAFVPKPHTSFQWAGQCDADTVTRRMRELKESIRSDRRYGRAITVKYADGRPGQVEGLLARGDRRVGAVIEAVWRDGGVFDGWSELFSYDRWMRCAEEVLSPQGLSMAWYTTRERGRDEVPPWEHLDVGVDADWLWDDWQDSLADVAVPDCRWAGCTDCGVCPELGVAIEMGPSGKTLLPLSVVGGRDVVAVADGGPCSARASGAGASGVCLRGANASGVGTSAVGVANGACLGGTPPSILGSPVPGDPAAMGVPPAGRGLVADADGCSTNTGGTTGSGTNTGRMNASGVVAHA
ncbi:MAG: TIGR03960 family B12-binding radical SAM protein [Propionibacteriaceae bacterium]|nr:TIGR03960 family B12-binding radical SAM protein [Propionibacteriaceae bacterium]